MSSCSEFCGSRGQRSISLSSTTLCACKHAHQSCPVTSHSECLVRGVCRVAPGACRAGDALQPLLWEPDHDTFSISKDDFAHNPITVLGCLLLNLSQQWRGNKSIGRAQRSEDRKKTIGGNFCLFVATS